MLNDSTIDSQPDIRVKSLRYGELDRSVVVAAAVRVAERGGVRSVTVRALAAELGLSTTAMYRYVDGKAELLNLIAEATLASVELPESGPWQQRIRVVANSARKAMLRIDGIADVLQTQPAKGAARQVDALMQQLVVDAGVPPCAARVGADAPDDLHLGFGVVRAGPRRVAASADRVAGISIRAGA